MGVVGPVRAAPPVSDKSWDRASYRGCHKMITYPGTHIGASGGWTVATFLRRAELKLWKECPCRHGGAGL